MLQNYFMQIRYVLQQSWGYFHNPWDFTNFAPMDDKIATFELPLFFDSLLEYDFSRYHDNVIHMLCTGGSMSFSIQHTRYHISTADYIILTPGILISNIYQSDDCSLLIMSFNEMMATKSAIQADYDIIGRMALLQDPVIRLNQIDFKKCCDDMIRLKERVGEIGHIFHYEMITALVKAHILDLYDIHAKSNKIFEVTSRPAELMRAFIQMLSDGHYRNNRTLEYYSSQLCVTPHYLSEVSNIVSKRPATYWIDLFLTNELSRLLIQKELPLAEIAMRLNFSSLSYLSRYVSKHFGMTPSEFRKTLK